MTALVSVYFDRAVELGLAERPPHWTDCLVPVGDDGTPIDRMAQQRHEDQQALRNNEAARSRV